MISVVIPCYNRSSLLARAIDSALAQGTYANEVIVVDDGSTDDTRGVCARYGARIAYVWQQNAGASVARNTGVERARNPWVAFLDSDDYWAAGHLSRMAEAITETNGEVRFYFSDMQMRPGDEDATLWKMLNFQPPQPIHFKRDATNWAFLRRQPTMLQCSVFRKDAWEENGGLDPRYRLMHDTELFFRLSIGGPACAVRGVGCVQTADDTSDVRLTTAVHNLDPAYWQEALALWGELLHRFPGLPAKYRRLVRHNLASIHWRLFRLHWSLRNLGVSARHLLMSGLTNPRFAVSLFVHRRADVNCPTAVPEYEN